MLPRWAIVFGGILALGGMLPWAIPFGGWGPAYWTALLVIAGFAAFLVRGGGSGGSENRWVSKGEFLCDSCRYNHPDHCSRPERPNASRCPDYRARG